jgi:hypothetical protein
MSTGHYHRYPNPLAPKSGLAQLNRKLTTGDAPKLMKRWNALNFDYDIVYGTGYNVQGTTRYVDRDLMRSLYDTAYAEKLLGAPINTGLSPDDTLECLLRHEMVEKVILDSQWPPGEYHPQYNSRSSFEIEGRTFRALPGAHDYATAAEHDLSCRKRR